MKRYGKISGAIFAVALMVILSMSSYVHGASENVDVNKLPTVINVNNFINLEFNNTTEYTILELQVIKGYVSIYNVSLKMGDVYLYEIMSNSTLRINGTGTLKVDRLAYGEYMHLNIYTTTHIYGYPYLSFKGANKWMVGVDMTSGWYSVGVCGNATEGWYFNRNVTFPLNGSFYGSSFLINYGAPESVDIEIKRVINPHDLAPVANGGGDRVVYANSTVQFNGWRSVDYDGMIVNYTWDFGDGTMGYGVNVTHVYSTPRGLRSNIDCCGQ